jgi:replicative DNA helicase
LATKIVSPRAELAVLRGMTSKDRKIAGTLIASVDESYFHSPESVEIYQAIKKQMAESGEAPTYRIMLEDPDLSEEAREHFRNSQPTVQTLPDAKKATKILNGLRQRRGLFNIAANINNEFRKTRVDIEDLLEKTSTGLNIVRSKKSTQDSFVHFGRNNNSLNIVKSILYEDNSDQLIPTGIKAFDDVSGGLARGSMVTIGANSGGGKSLVTMAMGMKMARMGFKVLHVPLEMSKREMTSRMMANTSGFNLTKIMTQRLEDAEKEVVFKRHRNWERKVKQAGGRFTVFRPEEDMDFEEIIAATSSYNCDVKIIDYVSLLKGTDGDDMWRALGAIGRQAKIHAETENCVVILVVQINDEGKIRYSRALTEHSSNSFTWMANREAKESGIVRVEQPKSRNSQSFPFLVKIDYEKMRIEDISQDYDSNLATPKDEEDEGKTTTRKDGKKIKVKSKIVNYAADV